MKHMMSIIEIGNLIVSAKLDKCSPVDNRLVDICEMLLSRIESAERRIQELELKDMEY